MPGNPLLDAFAQAVSSATSRLGPQAAQPFQAGALGLPSEAALPIPGARPVAASRQAPRPMGPTANSWPTRFDDPTYDFAEQAASQATGVPAEVLRAIRMHGERSNNGQVSSAGAQTPYQFIPSTRNRFVSERGIDPWADPMQGAMAAALHLKEDFDRTGSWPAALAGYNGGPRARDAVASGRAPPAAETQGYLARTMQALGLPANMNLFGQGFDPSTFDPVFGSINQAAGAAMTPFSADVARPPMPEPPPTPDLPSRDFSGTDKILAEMAPQAFSPQQESATRRRMLWQGAAQGLASLGDESGVGTILARVGAGMLGGRMAADEEIQARADAYDEKMRQYNALRFQNESGKADAMFEEATAEAGMAYQRANQLYSAKLADWHENGGRAQIVGNALQTRTINPDGSIKINNIPIASLTLPQFSMARASTQQQIAGIKAEEAVSDQRLVESAIISSVVPQAAATAFAQDVDQGTALATSAAVYAATAVQSGLLERFVSPETLTELTTAANSAAGITVGARPTAEQLQIQQDYLTGQLMEYVLTPDGSTKLQQLLPVLSGLRAAKQERTTRIRAGNTTTTIED